jgi:hypothetical protein
MEVPQNKNIHLKHLNALTVLLENRKERRDSVTRVNALRSLLHGAIFDKAMFACIEPLLLKFGFNHTPSEAFDKLKKLVLFYKVCTADYFEQWAAVEMLIKEDGNRRAKLKHRWEQM